MVELCLLTSFDLHPCVVCTAVVCFLACYIAWVGKCYRGGVGREIQGWVGLDWVEF
jgi:hypothetical protein